MKTVAVGFLGEDVIKNERDPENTDVLGLDLVLHRYLGLVLQRRIRAPPLARILEIEGNEDPSVVAEKKSRRETNTWMMDLRRINVRFLSLNSS